MSRTAQLALAAILLAGCATMETDYSAFAQHKPRSILVLPPLNEAVAVEATYSYLSTISMPLGEAGYYVFPVAVVDAFMQDNGLPTPGEMHEVPLAKLREVFQADAVLYVTIVDWGQKYLLLTSNTVVKARASLVDTRSGTLLWKGYAFAQQGSGTSGNIVSDLISAALHQIIFSTMDESNKLARRANMIMVLDENRGLPYGPYHPGYESDPRAH